MSSNIIYHAYTTTYNGLSNKLINDIKAKAGEKCCQAKAQWDTGASGTCISEELVSKLELIPTGKQIIQTPSGSLDVNTYIIDIMLPNNLTITDVMVCGTKIGNQGIQMLIGMDVISLGDLSVSNYNGKTVFSFRIPSKKTTDYVKEINLENRIGQKHGKGKRKKK